MYFAVAQVAASAECIVLWLKDFHWAEFFQHFFHFFFFNKSFWIKRDNYIFCFNIFYQVAESFCGFFPFVVKTSVPVPWNSAYPAYIFCVRAFVVRDCICRFQDFRKARLFEPTNLLHFGKFWFYIRFRWKQEMAVRFFGKFLKARLFRFRQIVLSLSLSSCRNLWKFRPYLRALMLGLKAAQ